MLRFLFPYFLLAIIVVSYTWFRHRKLGAVIHKVERRLFSRHNTDSLMMIIVMAALSFFLIRVELRTSRLVGETPFFGEHTYVFFYGLLLLAVILREVERPALRQKGISTPRGFWLWQDIENYRWTKNKLTVNASRGLRKRTETWEVKPENRKTVNQLMKKLTTGRSKIASKKKG